MFTSMIILHTLVNGFGWAMLAVLCGAAVAYLFNAEITAMFSRRFSLEECETVEEIAVIEGARAELADRLRSKASEAAKKAQEARFTHLEVEIALTEIDAVIREATLKEISRRIFEQAECERLEAASRHPQYWAVYESTQLLAERLDSLRSASVERLRSLAGIGKVRARRIYMLGESLSLSKLREICGPTVAFNTLGAV